MKNKIIKTLKQLLVIIAIMLPFTMVNATEVKLVRVVDGDTLKVQYPNGVVNSVRLAGIDTPESYLNLKAKKDIVRCNVKDYIMIHIGLTAKEFIKHNYPVGTMLNIDILTKGRYKRDVVYIKGLQEAIILNGYGKVKSYSKHDKVLVSKLLPLQDEAKRNNTILWNYLKNNCF